MKSLNEFKLSELMNLPVRKWDEITEYDVLLVVVSIPPLVAKLRISVRIVSSR